MVEIRKTWAVSVWTVRCMPLYYKQSSLEETGTMIFQTILAWWCISLVSKNTGYHLLSGMIGGGLFSEWNTVGWTSDRHFMQWSLIEDFTRPLWLSGVWQQFSHQYLTKFDGEHVVATCSRTFQIAILLIANWGWTHSFPFITCQPRLGYTALTYLIPHSNFLGPLVMF